LGVTQAHLCPVLNAETGIALQILIATHHAARSVREAEQNHAPNSSPKAPGISQAFAPDGDRRKVIAAVPPSHNRLRRAIKPSPNCHISAPAMSPSSATMLS